MTLGGDTMYLTSPRFGKEKMPVSVILNFISKAHKLGYHIKLTRKSRRDRVNLVFTPTEYDFSAYKSPWVLDRIGEYAIGMIADAVDEVDLQGMEINRFDYPSQRKMKKKPRTTMRRRPSIYLSSPQIVSPLEVIGHESGLVGHTLKRFVNFGLLWWGENPSPSYYDYITEWAVRFERGKEYDFADRERLNILREVDGVETSRGKLIDAYIRGGSTRATAERETMKYYPKARRGSQNNMPKSRKTTKRTTRKPKRINMRHSTKNH
jgi:hypothetical protein